MMFYTQELINGQYFNLFLTQKDNELDLSFSEKDDNVDIENITINVEKIKNNLTNLYNEIKFHKSNLSCLKLGIILYGAPYVDNGNKYLLINNISFTTTDGCKFIDSIIDLKTCQSLCDKYGINFNKILSEKPTSKQLDTRYFYSNIRQFFHKKEYFSTRFSSQKGTFGERFLAKGLLISKSNLSEYKNVIFDNNLFATLYLKIRASVFFKRFSKIFKYIMNFKGNYSEAKFQKLVKKTQHIINEEKLASARLNASEET